MKYIGIDIGGTKILLQVFDSKMNVIAEKQIKTDLSGQEGFLKQMYGLIDEFFDKKIKGIGVAVPGIVDKTTGILIYAPNLPAGRNLKLKKLLAERYGTAVHIDNDINAFLVSEYERPKFKKYKNVLAIMLGTGFGGAVISDGKLMYGSNGFAGEFGHIVINKDAKLKTLEENTGGKYLEKYPKLKKDLIMNFGIGLANLSLVFDPDAIVLGGSVYLNHLADKKEQIKKIIASHSLAGKSPALIDADSKTSVTKGAVLMLRAESLSS